MDYDILKTASRQLIYALSATCSHRRCSSVFSTIYFLVWAPYSGALDYVSHFRYSKVILWLCKGKGAIVAAVAVVAAYRDPLQRITAYRINPIDPIYPSQPIPRSLSLAAYPIDPIHSIPSILSHLFERSHHSHKSHRSHLFGYSLARKYAKRCR